MVAMNVWPTDAADGSVANEARWRKMGRLWTPTGAAAAAAGSALLPTLAFPNLTVKAGGCWVDGHFCELPGDQVLAVTANGLAVVRFDPAANTAQLLYLDGVTVPAQSPTGTYEMPVAKISGSALIDVRAVVTSTGTLTFPSVAARDFNMPAAGGNIGATCVTADTGTQWIVIPLPTPSWSALPQTTPWVGFTFQNGWTNFLGGHISGAYRKVGDTVQLRGLVNAGVVGGATPIATLPGAFRPAATHFFGTVSNGVFGLVSVASDGTITALAPSTNAYVSLNGLTFSTSP
jgi:hypothetical protein